jgi:hypothetical protein
MRTRLAAAIGFMFCAEAPTVAVPARYYQVRREERSCNLTICSEYVLTELGREGREQRAARLDFSPAHLDDATVAAALAAPPGELVVYGALAPTVDTGAVLGVERAYRGMPDVSVGPGERWFVVAEAGDPVAPSGGLAAHPIGGDGGVPITSVALGALEGFRIQTSWLEHRVAIGGAVVAGRLSGEVLEADQVFDQLPDRGGPCPLIHHACFDGLTPVYTRAENRCLVFQGCVGPRLCPDFLPAPCDAGYTRVRWASASPACWSEVCDPSFLTE